MLILSLRLALAVALSAALAAQPGNVLIVVADDVGVENIGSYGVGATPPPTPNLDALAGRGVLFRNAWSFPVCSPTRACVMTGRYAFRTGVGASTLSNSNVLARSEVTIPEQLDAEQSGYTHAAIGKWHLSDERNGGALGPNIAGFGHYAGTIQGIGDYYRYPLTINGSTRWVSGYNTTRFVDEALAWMQTAPEPWVCYLALNAAHKPFHAPPAALHSYDLTGLNPDTTPIPFYKASIEAMDSEIGRLLGGLGGLVARTDVLFYGDNGTPSFVAEAPYTPATVKGSPYQGGIHVPLIVAGPSVTSGGREEQALVGAVDLFSTVLDLCGVSDEVAWRAIDGISFAPHLRQPGLASSRSYAFAEKFRGLTPFIVPNGWVALRDARYKLVAPVWAPQELYDLAADPFEANDLLTGTLTPTETAALRGLRTELARLRNPRGSLQPFGTAACLGSAGVPTITGLQQPAIGGSYAIELQNGPAGTACVLVFGESNTVAAGQPLPMSLAPLGAGPGCMLHTSLEFAVSMATDGSGRAVAPIAIPPAISLLGMRVHHTWAVVDPAAPSNPLGVTTTSGITAEVGL